MRRTWAEYNKGVRLQSMPDLPAKRAKARRSTRLGDNAEMVVRNRLVAMGLKFVERISTGWRPIRMGGKIVGASPLARVAGDWRAVGPGGQSVLVEVKLRPQRLVFSDLAPHQIISLDDHAAAGGLSLLAFVSAQGVSICRWRVPGFGPGDSMTPAHAALFQYLPEEP